MRVILFSLWAIFTLGARAAESVPPSGWQYYQTLELQQAGFIKIALPPETMNLARPDLADLRIFSGQGEETPFVVGIPKPVSPEIHPVERVTSSIQDRSTRLVIETGVSDEIDAVLLDSPVASFVKAANLEGSNDGKDWHLIAEGKPLFRLNNGAAQLDVSFPPRREAFLRISINDERSEPVPFSNVRVRSTPRDLNPPRSLATKISETEDLAGETRIVLQLGAANVFVSSVQLDVSHPFFTRSVSVSVPKLRENEVVEEQIATGNIRRLRLDETATSENNIITVERQVPADTLILTLRNNDSPPLKIAAVTVVYRPFTSGFYVTVPGRYLVATGNGQAQPPRYDLSVIRADVAKLAISDAKLGPVTPNPAYREGETLPGIAETGAPIDPKEWRFRKQIQVSAAGIQQLQLDPETLSLAAPGLNDLRVVQKEAQLPYLLRRTSSSAEIAVKWSASNDVSRPTVSGWKIGLPFPALPIAWLTAEVQSTLFQRTMILYELGGPGKDERRVLGQATWTRKPGQTNSVFTLEVNGRPDSDQLLLETENGDNAPITLGNLKLSYPVTKLMFKAGADPALHLYFGNEGAHAPQYDLSIAGEQILKADKRASTLGPLERLKPEPFAFTSRGTSAVFWGVLVLVVLGLLAIISRLLPPARTS